MKKPIQKIFVLVSTAIIMLGAGCQSTVPGTSAGGRLSAEQELTGEKKSKLIAAENVQLKKESIR